MTDTVFSVFSDSQPGAWVQDGMVVAPPTHTAAAKPHVRNAAGTVRKMTITLTTTLTFLMAAPMVPIGFAGSGPLVAIIAPDGLRETSTRAFDVSPVGTLREARNYLRSLAEAPPPEPIDLDFLV